MSRPMLSALLLLAATLSAQTILLPPGKTYPLAKSTVVNPDHTITFRLADPNAKSVHLRYDMSAGPIPMVRDATGLWSFTSAPLPPEIYAYTFSVDGEPRLDPSNRRTNEVATGAVSQSIEIPGHPSQPWDLTNIPHGDLTQHRFTTHIGKNFPNDQSSYLVYTPPNFNPRAATKYPVLYLLNGYSQLETGWRDLHANLILDTLIAQHKAVPMIVVMPLSYGDLTFLDKGGDVWKDRAAVSANIRLFAQILVHEIIPQVESHLPRLQRPQGSRSRRPLHGRPRSSHHWPQRHRPVRLDRRL